MDRVVDGESRPPFDVGKGYGDVSGPGQPPRAPPARGEVVDVWRERWRFSSLTTMESS